MPYTVSCNPAPLTFTIRPRFDWKSVMGIAWICFVAYRIGLIGWDKTRSTDPFGIIVLALISSFVLLSFIRRERIEIYPDRMVWRKTYFGVTRSQAAPLSDVLGAEWNEGAEQAERGKGPDYVEFFLPNGSVKACYGFTFDDFDHMRNDIRPMYPDLIRRWGQSTIRSKSFTLLNLS